MSQYQSRADTNSGHLRRPGRSTNSGHNRGFSVAGSSGGRGGAVPPSSNPPALSGSRSFKKSGNGQGGQPRVTPASAGSAPPNGSHVHVSVRGPPESAPSGGTKPVEAPAQRASRAVPKAPSSNTSHPVAGASETVASSTPPKGAASKGFNLQFGSISPGLMNGMQIPARTSSAPPNLVEQKQAQAHHDSVRAMPTVPMPAAPKQQQLQARKDVGGHSLSNTAGESHPPTQIRRDVHLPVSSATAVPPRPSVLPIGGIPVHMQFQQPQLPMQYGGPNPQMQSQGVTANSLQMTMAIPVMNGPQVPQQLFVANFQSHPLQPQNLMHQGQSLGFAPQIGHQVPPQLGNLGFGMGPQFTQQHSGNFGGPRKTTVKITHPDTHEELKLDKRTESHVDGGASGQRPLSNVTGQSQPVQTFSTSHQIGYYPPLQPNTYSPSPMFFPAPTSHPLTTTHMTTGPQSHLGPRYSYAVGQSGQAAFLNPSGHNHVTVSKPGAPATLRGVSEAANVEVSPLSAPFPVTIRPPVTSFVQRTGAPSVTISMPSSNTEAPKLLKPQGDASVSHQKKDAETMQERVMQDSKPVDQSGNASLSVAEPIVATSALPTQRMQSGTSALGASVGDSGPIGSAAEGNIRESVQRSDSWKDRQKKTGKKDAVHTLQHNQTTAADSVGSTKLSSKLIKDRADVSAQEAPRSSEKVLPLLGSDSLTATTKMASLTEEYASNVEFQASEVKEIPTSLGSIVTIEKEASQDSGPNCADSVQPLNSSNILKEGGSLEALTSLSPKLESSLSDFALENKHRLSDSGIEDANLIVAEHETVETRNDLQHDISSSRSYPVTTMVEKPEAVSSVISVKLEDVRGSSCEKENVCELLLQINKEEVDRRLEVDGKSVKSDVPSIASSDIKDAVTTKCETVSSQEVDMGAPVTSLAVSEPLISTVFSEMKQKFEGQATQLSSGSAGSVILSGPKDKPTSEPARARINAGRKKKRKEILSKADAAGNPDLYNAYKGPEEKHEAANPLESTDSSSMVNTTHTMTDVTDKDVVGEEDGQSKTEIDDWEDAADISTPKLRTEDEATSKKRYSRDFLLTFADQCTNLPVGFDIGSDIADAVMSVPVGTAHIFDRDPYPSPGRITDKSPGASRVDRCMAGVADDGRWTKAASFGPGRDIRLDMGHGAATVSLRPGQGVNHGVRNTRAQSNHFVGGLLSGPMQSMTSQGGMPRSNSDADRWQRATGIQRGLIPSPHAPSQMMHKAANKYEVGKVSDAEQAKQRQLKAILNKLTPQNFDKLFFQVKEVNIDNADTLMGVISQIFDKALMEPTFCEMYANFCVHLSDELPDFNEDNEKITFKRLLLNKCQEEFERGEREEAEANRAEEEGELKQTEEQREEKRIQARRRMLGNIRLIGELYKKRMLTERIMHECIKKLLGEYENPDEEDVEALCKLMSTIGEMIDHPKARVHMDAYFDRMFMLSTNQKLSSRVRFMLRDAIDLRKNKWQQRRKVEGPKKIDEVHRDAAQERQAQASRLARGPVIISAPRRGPSVDYGSRGSAVLSSPSSQHISGSRALPAQVRGYAIQDVRMDDRHHFESRMSVPLPQRSTDDSITLGPQGGLVRGMSVRGQPLLPNVPSADISPNNGDPRRLPSGHDSYSFIPREDNMPRYLQDNFSSVQDRPNPERMVADPMTDRSTANTVPGKVHGSSGIRHPPSKTMQLSEEILREKSISAIREFYSAKDEEEVSLCIKELNSPSFYPSMVSLWVTDSFERKDMERGLLAKLLVHLCKSRDSLLSENQLVEGFESVLSSLEDAVNDAPKAAEFLGHIFARIALENVVPLGKLANLIREGGEEPGSLVEAGLASEVLGSILEFIRMKKGDLILTEVRTSSCIRLEDFRPSRPIRSNKLDAFL